MSEIYRDATNVGVTLDITNAVVSAVKFVRGGTVIASASSSPASIPYAITHTDGPFTVDWTYTVEGNEYNRTDEHDVVTPLFTQAELVAFNSTFSTLSGDKVKELERLVRGIIQGYCGQRFGLQKDTISIYGRGQAVLISPRRVVSIDGISGLGLSAMYAYSPVKAGYTIAVDTSRYSPSTYPDPDTYQSTVPIIAPPTFSGGDIFRNGTLYTVTGTFGWNSVPTDVKQAALILAEQFSCREASWRDRYLKAVTAADWRFDFDTRAFIGTGSVTVDQLLAQYVVGGMAII